jgi:hypothetical protein
MYTSNPKSAETIKDFCRVSDVSQRDMTRADFQEFYEKLKSEISSNLILQLEYQKMYSCVSHLRSEKEN